MQTKFTSIFAKATIVLLLAIFVPPTEAWGQKTLPYEYGFENNDLAAEGWTTTITSGNSGIQSGVGHSEAYGFRFCYTESSDAYLVSPLLTIGENGVDVSFYYKSYSTSYPDQFQVGYTTDESVTDASAFTYGETISETTGNWTEYTHTFPAGTKRIAIKYLQNNGDGYYLYLDDFSFDVLDGFTKPTNLAVSDVTTKTAVLSWTEMGTATEWVIAYKAEGDDDFTEVNATTNPFTLTDLTPETGYSVKVRQAGNGNTKWSDGISFTTAVHFPAPTALAASNITATSATINWTGNAESYNLRYRADHGFHYNFETAEAFAVDEFSPCTTYDGDGIKTYGINNYDMPNTYYIGSVIAFSDNDHWAAHSGNTMGAFIDAIPDTDAGITANDDYFILPAITIESGSNFSFWARSVTSQYGLERMKVGVYGGNGTFSSYLAGSATTYVEVPTDWTEFSYDLSAYVGQTIQLAINCVSSDAFALLIDDIDVSLPIEWSTPIAVTTTNYQIEGLTPETNYTVQVQSVYTDGESKWAGTKFTTPELFARPTGVQASNITKTSATISWTAGGEETAWDLYVTYDKTDVPDDNTTPTVAGTSSNPYNLTGLTSDIYCYVYVRAINGEGKSHWSTPVLFTLPIVLPYSYGFEDAADFAQWSLVNCDNSTEIQKDYNHSGNYGLDFCQSSSSSDQYLISPQLDGSAGVTLSFYYKNRPAANYTMGEEFKVGYSTTTNDVSAFTWGDNISVTGGEWTLYEKTTFPVGTKYICIKSDVSYHLYLDDFSFEVPVPVPTNLVATDITTTSATVTWDDVVAEKWNLRYKTISENAWTTVENLTETTYSLSNLTTGSAYQVQVQAVYTNTTSVWIDLHFATIQGLPYSCGFEDYSDLDTWSMVECQVNTDIRNYAYRNGSRSFCFYNTNTPPQYLISPLLDGSAGVALSFYYKNADNTYPETFMVGYSTTTNDVSAFTWGDEITANDKSNWKEYTQKFPVGTKYVAVKCTSNNKYYLYLDDFTLTDFTNIKVNLELADNADNSTLITDNDGNAADVTLSGRTLTANNWNTLCVPFNLSSAQIESVFGAGTLVKTLSSYANDGTTVTITFANADEIVAGKPYIIMPANTVANPIFSSVVIDKTMRDVEVTGATFKGTYGPTPLTANDRAKLFLANNMLYYPSANLTVRACRAYFELASDVPDLGTNAPNIVVDFGDQTTKIVMMSDERSKTEDAWYTLDGRKLSGKPTTKGIYVRNGVKMVIK